MAVKGVKVMTRAEDVAKLMRDTFKQVNADFVETKDDKERYIFLVDPNDSAVALCAVGYILGISNRDPGAIEFEPKTSKSSILLS